MKLRIKGNSVRLRLTQSEVNTIAEGRAVVETTQFPAGSRFTYVLETGQELDAKFSDHRLIVSVPLQEARNWATGSDVAIQAQLKDLSILIEKDFACLKPREDESDMFPNPNFALGHCT